MPTFKSNLILLILLLPLMLASQTVETVLQQYLDKLEQIQSISCEVEQLDTFVTGHVWHYTGKAILLRNPDEPIWGFNYKASKTVGGEALYDGERAFEIDHATKAYELNANPQSYILGSPGGQLIVPELMVYQDDTIVPSLLIDQDHYILVYPFPDLPAYQVVEREKRIYLSKTSLLPEKVSKRQVSLGKLQVLTRIIRHIEINQPAHADQFDKHFLEDYKIVQRESRADLHKDLIHTQAADFTLPDFDGNLTDLKPKKGNVLLIDFWEVWCGPCQQSMPKVQELYETYQNKGLDVVGVLMDKNSMDSAQLFLDKKGFSFPQLIGGQALRDYFKVNGIPQYVLIDKAGKIQFIYQGYHEAIAENIKTMLAETH
ncbi:MAG: TlpA disulfide reductase family protein [Saprospiraceae bacterium]